MKVEFLGAYGGSTNTSNLTSFFVDDCLAIDAGSLTQQLPLDRQFQIDHVLVSHTHLDHTLSLPFLADNIFGQRQEPMKVWAAQTVIDSVREHIFNEVIWPDFTILPNAENPTIAFHALEPEKPREIAHFRVTSIPVNHAVPCTGFLLESLRDDVSILYSADTERTDRIWEFANRQTNLKAIIVDCSFPNKMRDLAIVSGHNTPEMLAEDLRKLDHDCQVLIYHIKPHFDDIMIRELKALKDPRIVCTIQNKIMNF